MKQAITIGQRFGSLVVSEQVGNVIHGSKSILAYKVLCDCGIEKILPVAYLQRSNYFKSCGCRRTPLNSMVRLYRYARETAKKRGKEFTLSQEKFNELSMQNYGYCNRIPSNVFKQKLVTGDCTTMYSGLDRIYRY